MNREIQEPISIVIDVPYFKSLLAKETETLNDLCEEWEGKLLTSFNSTTENSDETSEEKTNKDDIEGQLRTTIGKAKILMSKKGRFQQFQDLITNCEFNYGEKKLDPHSGWNF